MAVTLGILFTTFWAYGQYGGGLLLFSSQSKFASVGIRARGNLALMRPTPVEVEEQVLEIEGIEHLVCAHRCLDSPPQRRRSHWQHVSRTLRSTPASQHPTEIWKKYARAQPTSGIQVEAEQKIWARR